MLTVIKKDQHQYQVWDPAPQHGPGFIEWTELDDTGLDYDNGFRLQPHELRHMLLLRRKN